jgi:transposase
VARAPRGLKLLGEHPEDGLIVLQAIAAECEQPSCPACATPMAKHGSRMHRYADTPLHGVPVRLEVERPRFRCGHCGRTATGALHSLDGRRRVTTRLAKAIHRESATRSLHALAAQTGLSVNTVRAIAHERLTP